MPNWVFNDLHIEGSKEAIQKVKAQLNAPYTRNNSEGEAHYSNPVISFLNIVRPPEDKMDEYEGMRGFKDGEKQGDSEFNWYNFNNREWGTKWDVAVHDGEKHSDTQLNQEDETKLHYYFQTAWSPPLPVIEALSLQHPELEITLRYEEEQGWGGEIYWDKTGSTIVEEWDTPASHADHVKRDIEDNCACANSEDKEDWYDDCPREEAIELYAKRDVIQLT
jgi:hypothetical protein